MKMRPEILTRSAQPWVHHLVATASDLSDAVVALEASRPPGQIAARVVGGRRATTKQAFLDETAAALQFPHYFGRNWDALTDCLTDLSWLRADAVVLCIADAGHLLEDASGRDVDALLEVMTQALRTVNDEGRGIGPKSLHLVLHTTPEERDLLQRRWEQTALDGAVLK
jgi:hypothetical protein